MGRLLGRVEPTPRRTWISGHGIDTRGCDRKRLMVRDVLRRKARDERACRLGAPRAHHRDPVLTEQVGSGIDLAGRDIRVPAADRGAVRAVLDEGGVAAQLDVVPASLDEAMVRPSGEKSTR